MLQSLRRFLGEYHKIFSAGRCSGWELEELIVKSIKSDTQANHHVKWRESGHDYKEDVQVKTNGKSYSLQIKSGQITKDYLSISGNRLGRFQKNFSKITDFLNGKKDNILSVPYKKVDDHKGRSHCYQIAYVDADIMRDLEKDKWIEKGKQYLQTNNKGVELSVRPSMSWQVWWKVPLSSIELKDLFIG